MTYYEYLEIMKKFGNPLPNMVKETYEIGMPLGAYVTEISTKYTYLNFQNEDILNPKTTEPNIYYEQLLLNKKIKNLLLKLNKINMDF
ncbi:MAG: hypothetical protein MJ211_09570 [Bacteroidales bacterium]|nr:hypothetical protein [Bacteroidales bacterium]